jgi:hypothetical protein
VTVDKIYVVSALLMQIGVLQNPTVRSYFSKNSVLATPIFSAFISMDQFEYTCKFIDFNNNDRKDTGYS